MNKCDKPIEYVTSHRWTLPCVLPQGHVGLCAAQFELSENQKRGWTGNVLPASISYPIDANGAPL